MPLPALFSVGVGDGGRLVAANCSALSPFCGLCIKRYLALTWLHGARAQKLYNSFEEEEEEEEDDLVMVMGDGK